MQPKSKTVAGVLGILVGWAGIHRFYLGDTKMGLVQLGVFLGSFVLAVLSCGLLSFLPLLVPVWGLVEGILIITGNYITTDAQGNPLE